MTPVVSVLWFMPNLDTVMCDSVWDTPRHWRLAEKRSQTRCCWVRAPVNGGLFLNRPKCIQSPPPAPAPWVAESPILCGSLVGPEPWIRVCQHSGPGLPFFTGTQKGVFVSTSLPRDRRRVVKKGFLTSSCSGRVKLFRSEPPPTPGLHVSSAPPPPRWVWCPRVRKHSSPGLRFPSWSPWQFFHWLLEELVCICSQLFCNARLNPSLNVILKTT